MIALRKGMPTPFTQNRYLLKFHHVSPLIIHSLTGSRYPAHENRSINANHVLAQLEKIEGRISSLKSDLLHHSRPPSGNHHAPTPPSQQSTYDPVKTAGGWAARMQHTIPAVLSGSHVVELATGATIFLGNRSDPPSVLGCRRTTASGVREGDDSGLDQLAPKTYSFASPWAPQTTVVDAAKVLPDDSDVIRYVEHVVY